VEQLKTWLKTQAYWNLDELVSYLDEHYGVFINPNRATTSCLRQELLEAITKVNPKHDAELVKTDSRLLQAHEAEIETGQLVVF